ncbi:MAG TPA: GAF domain-containing sensor histidine kinase [Gemmatimonadaceae bacterium]
MPTVDERDEPYPSTAALAAENARLSRSERLARVAAHRATERAARLHAVTAALSSALAPGEVASVVVNQGIAAMEAQAGSLAVLNAAHDALDVLAMVGYDPELAERFRYIPLDARFPLADVVRTGVPVWLRSYEERDARYPNLAALRRANGSGAMAAIPLTVHGRTVGAMGLNFHEAREFAEDDIAFILALAEQCAQALDRTRLYAAERGAREEAERARIAAEAANRAKSEFLATMSHELRTPLNAIGGYVELMLMGIRGPLTEQQREDLQRIERNQRYLLGLINDILNFARLESGRVTLALAPVAVDATLAELDALMGPQMRAKGIRYTYRSGDPSVTVRADRERLEQIVLNLLSNALKFTESGDVVLEWECLADEVAIRVRDTGDGIPSDRMQQIFEPFVQLDRGYRRTTDGAGLGLAISRELARAMYGDLTATSTVGIGSTFTLTLPRAATPGDCSPPRDAGAR